MEEATSSNKPAIDFDFNATVERAKGMIFSPDAEWQKVDQENLSTIDNLKKYIILLAAIPAVSALIATSIKVSLTAGIITGILNLVLAIALPWLVSYIVAFLAPKFGGESNQHKAFALLTFSVVPGYLAGILQIFMSGFLSFVGAVLALYGLYIFSRGITPMAKVPKERRIGFFAVTVITYIAVAFVVGIIGATVALTFGITALG